MKKKFIYDGKETNYSISDLGEVFNDKTGKQLKGTYARNEYHSVQLTIEGKPKTFLTHCLVAETFIPNPNNYSVVDHINRDKHDNRAENLRWTTLSENAQNCEKKASFEKEKYIEDFEGEKWLPIKNYSDYFVSNFGRVRNDKTGYLLKGSLRAGYLRVCLQKKNILIHLLVWETFVGPKVGVIDHIDGNKLNNCLDNLRDVSQSENMISAQKNGHKGQVGVTQFSADGQKIAHYLSLQAAREALGSKVTTASLQTATKYGTRCMGYYWLRDDSLSTEQEFVSGMPDDCNKFLGMNKTRISQDGERLYSMISKHLIPLFEDEKGKYWWTSSPNGSYIKQYK